MNSAWNTFKSSNLYFQQEATVRTSKKYVQISVSKENLVATRVYTVPIDTRIVHEKKPEKND